MRFCLERLGALDKNGDYGEFGARYRARGPSGRGGSASDGPRQQMGPSAKTHSDDVSPHLPLRNRPFGGGIFLGRLAATKLTKSLFSVRDAADFYMLFKFSNYSALISPFSPIASITYGRRFFTYKYNISAKKI